MLLHKSRTTLWELLGESKESVLFADGATFTGAGKIEAIARGTYQTKSEADIRGTGYVVESLEAALWCFLRTDTFEQAILMAANLGDDADTTAAIAGQLAGARWGASAIPDKGQQKLVAKERIVSLARGLFVAGGGEVESSAWPHDEFIHAWWVDPDRLLAGEYPGHMLRTRAREKFI